MSGDRSLYIDDILTCCRKIRTYTDGMTRSMELKLIFPLTFNRLFMLCGLCIMLNGCASKLAPTYDEITIKTEPEGAKVYDENGWKFLGITPLTHSFITPP